ncbi:MAG: V-type ATP synthase subunit D [Candidatus Methanofastidiosa archaeon]|jgi:V/A-type H+-transporting ATPase subunit D|nr:V-type ATP synthase subunit D [Candidatus Methanofastidiosa archaeon]MDD4280990.1 V-type ATP synthase subunit D [Candidatus Methanofastidiosa archaeon]
MSIEQIKPTRMALLQLKKRIMLAQKGHELLKKKRDSLVMQFFDLVSERKTLRSKAHEQLEEAYASLMEAQMLVGKRELENLSLAIPVTAEFDVRVYNIMGVVVPLFNLRGKIKRPYTTRGYTLINTSAKVDEVVDSFQTLTRTLFDLAEVEEQVRLVAEELESTKRRVNALEYVLIPKLRSTFKWIEQSLEEREREDFFRLKRMKNVLKG